jgi:hypothetical protein
MTRDRGSGRTFERFQAPNKVIKTLVDLILEEVKEINSISLEGCNGTYKEPWYLSFRILVALGITRWNILQPAATLLLPQENV